MRNVSLLATVIITLVSLLCPVARGGEAGERRWSVGYAEADITPAPGQVQMCGFGRERYARGVLAPLLTAQHPGSEHHAGGFSHALGPGGQVPDEL
jgi:hypothetical protein